jgi:hypothetical protein
MSACLVTATVGCPDRLTEQGIMNQFRWRKSSFSGYAECVELAYTLGVVRDSKNPRGPVVAADRAGLLAAAKRGDLDRRSPVSSH